MHARNTYVTAKRATGLAALAVTTLLNVGCGGCLFRNSSSSDPSPGTRLEFGKTILYFTPGVAETEARKVGALLSKSKEFVEHGAVLQLRYQNRRYEVRFVARAGAENTRETLELRALGQHFSKECFGGSPVDIHLCDERWNTLRTVPFEPLKPLLPLEVTFRSSIGGGSLVARYMNTSDKYLAVSVALRNPTLDQAKTVVLNIGPNRVTEHGWLQGWSYSSGETITITHADYEVMELRVP